MAYFVADEKLQGYYVSDGVTINIVKYHFECDDAASLPAQTAFISSKKVKISMASTAHTIDTDAMYKMDSYGAWVQQSQPWQPLADYSVLSNKPQINGHTLTGNHSGANLGLQNVLTFDAAPTQNSTNPVTSGGIWADQQRQDALQTEDRAALIDLVDGGAKNQFDPASAWDSKTAYGVTITRNEDTYSIESGTTQSGDNNFVNMGYQANTNLIPAGDWVLSFDTPQQNVCFQVCWDGQLRVNSLFGNNCFFTVPENTTNSWFRIRLRGGTEMSGTSFKIMLCPSAFWKISQTYQPYRPSWQQMYDMILALQ